MTPRPAALVFLLASALLHAAMLFAIAGSARGAQAVEPDEQQAARWLGSTFEIEGVLGAVQPDETASQRPRPPLDESARPEPAPSQPLPEQPSRAGSAEPPALEASEPAAEEQSSERPPEDHAPAAVAEPNDMQAPSERAGRPEPSTPHSETAPAPADQPAPDSAMPAPGASSSATPGGAPGEPVVRPGVGSLAKAFTRAVPRAAFRDPAWHGLALGAAGSITFSIELDAEGRLVEQALVIDKEPAPPEHLERLVTRTTLMLKAGSFALTPAGVQAGKQRLELSAAIRKVEALDDALAEPRDLRQIGRLVEPTWVRPGKANFTYNSGRQVELTLRMLAN